MPKLRGSKLKYVNGYAVDKENDNIMMKSIFIWIRPIIRNMNL